MPSNKIDKNNTAIFNEIFNEIQKEISPDKIYALIDTTFIDKTSYDFIAIYIYEDDSKFKIKNKVDKKLLLPKEITDSKIVIDYFKEKKLRIIKKKKKSDSEFSDLFIKIKKIKTTIFFPLIKNENIYGFIWLALKENNKYKPDYTFLNILLQLINCSLGNLLLFEIVKKHNKELQSIAKSMRHDFANDLQSIAMVNELLLTTELNNDQTKFVRLLGSAKDSATEKLSKIKQLKDKFDKEIDYTIGLSLNK
ncbi:MAG: hypothetical protein FK730_02105 [Asgard group archaeon]|nr:hypothetical protein [Asgard group archaeon]